MQDKQPTMLNVAMSATSDIPGCFAVLTRNATFQQLTRANSSGVWAFYDMDDSNSQVYSIATYTQDGATGEAWTATVTGNVVVVTKTFAAQRSTAAFFA